MLVRVVIIGDDPSGVSLDRLLPSDDATAERRDPRQFWTDPGESPFDLALVTSSDLPGGAAAAIRRVRALPQRPEVVVLGSGIEEHNRLRLLAAGCFAIVPAELGQKGLAKALAKLISRRREALAIAVRAERVPRLHRVDDFVSNSRATRDVLRIARRVAVSDTSLLLLGETGSGKEWLANAVHAESPRAANPFIPVNCGAIPETLLESELFGHEKGAFTGAARARRGYFEQAHGGTLFLDEIAEMPPQLQVRLLRVLHDRKIQRLGSESSIEVDTRIVAATHSDLKAEIESGRFRSDLYYRLAVVTLTMPPLRQRVEDISTLVEIYLRRLTRKLARPQLTGLTEAAMQALTSYRWPGNVRELINVIERAVLLCDGEEIDLVDLPVEISMPAGLEAQQAAGRTPLENLDAWFDQPVELGRMAVLADFERRYFARLLERYRGHVGKTARQAGVNPRTLYNKMRQLGLRKEDYRGG